MQQSPPISVTRLRGEGSTPTTATPHRVLFVDDQELVGRAFARSMRRHGFDVDVAMSGKEALQRSSEGQYHVLVTDLAMPGMDGVTLIERLMARGDDLAFVVASGHGELYVRGEYHLDDLDIHVIDKPWNDREVAALLHRLGEKIARGRARDHGDGVADAYAAEAC